MAIAKDYTNTTVLEERARFFAELVLGRETRVTFGAEYSEDENLRYFTFTPIDPDGELEPSDPEAYERITTEFESTLGDHSEKTIARRNAIHLELFDLTRTATNIFVLLSYMLDSEDEELEDEEWWFSKVKPDSQLDKDIQAEAAFAALTPEEQNFITGNDVSDSWMPPGPSNNEITDGLESAINEDPTMEEYLEGDDLPDDDGRGKTWNDPTAGAPYYEDFSDI